MKERLDRENIEALAAYRFQRAEETLKEIPYLCLLYTSDAADEL